MVVDLWGGWADEAKTRPWDKDTIVNVYSTTKTMTFLCALILADRGELDFDAPVARYWPQFAAGGKAAVKVSHLMAHSAGLSGWRETITTADLYDWEKVTALLAAQTPLWEPGTKSGYHAITQAYRSLFMNYTEASLSIQHFAAIGLVVFTHDATSSRVTGAVAGSSRLATVSQMRAATAAVASRPSIITQRSGSPRARCR